MLIPLATPIRGEAGQVAHLSNPSFTARSPLYFRFTAANVDLAVEHGLGRVPEGFIVVGASAGVVVYNGSVPSSEDLLILRATGAADVYVLPL